MDCRMKYERATCKIGRLFSCCRVEKTHRGNLEKVENLVDREPSSVCKPREWSLDRSEAQFLIESHSKDVRVSTASIIIGITKVVLKASCQCLETRRYIVV
jgi:hypothetical protein